MEMLGNLKLAIDKKYGNQKSASEAMGVNPGNLSKLINRNPSEIRKPTIEKIKAAFSEYNIDWILHNKLPVYSGEVGGADYKQSEKIEMDIYRKEFIDLLVEDRERLKRRVEELESVLDRLQAKSQA